MIVEDIASQSSVVFGIQHDWRDPILGVHVSPGSGETLVYITFIFRLFCHFSVDCSLNFIFKNPLVFLYATLQCVSCSVRKSHTCEQWDDDWELVQHHSGRSDDVTTVPLRLHPMKSHSSAPLLATCTWLLLLLLLLGNVTQHAKGRSISVTGWDDASTLSFRPLPTHSRNCHRTIIQRRQTTHKLLSFYRATLC